MPNTFRVSFYMIANRKFQVQAKQQIKHVQISSYYSIELQK